MHDSPLFEKKTHPFDLLIFDLDGTLVDTRKDLANSVNFALQNLDLPALEVDEVTRMLGDGMRKLLQRALPESRQEELPQAISFFKQHYSENYLVESCFYPGVREVLERFSDRKMAVVSNKPEAYVIKIIEGLAVTGHFGLILGGDSVPALKPDPEPVIHTLTTLDCPPETALMVGDSPSDIIAGREAGTATCAVSYGYRPVRVLLQNNPDFVIDEISQLAAIVS